jgi:alpha-1,2-glucosyltransferase
MPGVNADNRQTTHKGGRLLAFLFVAAVFSSVLAILPGSPIIDESVHYKVIGRLLRGDFNLGGGDEIAMLPGYHYLCYVIASLAGTASIEGIRAIGATISLASIAVFYGLVKSKNTEVASVRSAQYAFLPVLFPFFFLTYTDATSIAFLLAAYYFLDRGEWAASGLFSFFSVLIRQNNIVWVVYFAALAFRGGRGSMSALVPYAPSLAIIAVLFFVNDFSLAFGHREYHPSFSFYTENIFNFLFVYFFLSLPEILHQSVNLLRDAAKARYLPVALGATLIVCANSFNAPHKFNLILQNHLLSSMIASAMAHDALFRAAYLIPVGFSILSLWRLGLNADKWVFYAFTVVYLAPFGNLDFRYYLVPLVLLLIHKKPTDGRVEWATAALYFATSMLLIALIAEKRMFL